MGQIPLLPPSTSLPREMFSGYRRVVLGALQSVSPLQVILCVTWPPAWHGTQHPCHRVNRCVFSASIAKIPQMKYFCPTRSLIPGNSLTHRCATGAPKVDPGMWALHTICLAPLAPPLWLLCPHSQSSALPRASSWCFSHLRPFAPSIAIPGTCFGELVSRWLFLLPQLTYAFSGHPSSLTKGLTSVSSDVTPVYFPRAGGPLDAVWMTAHD